MSLRTVLMIAEQIVLLIYQPSSQITRLEYVHSKDFVHRDIKPENFLLGRGINSKTIYLIDYGLTTFYRDSGSGLHIPFHTHRSLIGTARYSSINTHLGVEQSRRDDLEAVGYLLIYLIKGRLPWQGIKHTTKKEKYVTIMDCKIATLTEALCKDTCRKLIWRFIEMQMN